MKRGKGVECITIKRKKERKRTPLGYIRTQGYLSLVWMASLLGSVFAGTSHYIVCGEGVGEKVEVSSLALSVVPQQTAPHTSALPSLFHGPVAVEVEAVVVVVGLEAGWQQVTPLSHLAAITYAASYLYTYFVVFFVFRLWSLLTFSLVAFAICGWLSGTCGLLDRITGNVNFELDSSLPGP